MVCHIWSVAAAPFLVSGVTVNAAPTLVAVSAKAAGDAVSVPLISGAYAPLAAA